MTLSEEETAKATYVRTSHNVNLCAYHIVWCPKRRKGVLLGEVANALESAIRDKCERESWKLIALAIQEDHVHVFLQGPVNLSPEHYAKQLKGFASYQLGKEIPLLKASGGSIWSAGYFVSTAGEIAASVISRYIEVQSGFK